MITVRLAGLDWSRIRFGISPLWEVVAAVRTAGVKATGQRQSWLERIIWRIVGIGAPLLRDLVDPGRPYLVDFLAPPPDRTEMEFEAEVERMQATPRALVARELRRAGMHMTARQVPAVLDQLGDELRQVWDGAVAAEWSMVRALLERDITYRGRQLARDGCETMLAGLHPTVVTGGAALRIEASRTSRSVPGKRGLLLVPSVFAWPMVYVVDAPHWRATIAYPARGVVDVGERVPARKALAALAGAGRSQVLLALRDGATTKELARSLRLSPGAVSQQLNRLRLAELVQSSRVGRFVLHELTRRGEAVVRAFHV